MGRLDRNTTGVLLLTNDGDLASKLTHPKFVKKKIYHVWTDKDVSEEDMQRIADGIELEDGPIHADAVSYATDTDKNQIGIEIHSGRNRIVRRIFEAMGYHVVKLDRVYFAGLTKKNLQRSLALPHATRGEHVAYGGFRIIEKYSSRGLCRFYDRDCCYKVISKLYNNGNNKQN